MSTRQLIAVVALGLKGLPQRVGSSSVVILCVAIVVMVMLGVLSLSHSLARVIGASGRSDRAILLSEGAELEGSMSAIARPTLAAIEQLPGIRRNAQGKAIVSAEILMYLPIRQRKDESRAHVVVRGVGPEAEELRPEVVIEHGRMLHTGINELVAGREAQKRFKGLDIGDTVKLRNVPFLVVGSFQSGDVRESEVIADVQALISIRPTARYQSITVQLESSDSMNAFKAAVEKNPSLGVHALSEPEHVKRQAIDATELLELVAYLVGTIMAAAASFSAANTLYTTVSARRKEIATLRAIGFAPSGVVIAIVVESLILSLTGAAIGVLLTAMVVNGRQFNSQTLSTQLRIDTTLIAIGAAWACGIALVSAVAPAIHAARMPIVRALREV